MPTLRKQAAKVEAAGESTGERCSVCGTELVISDRSAFAGAGEPERTWQIKACPQPGHDRFRRDDGGEWQVAL